MLTASRKSFKEFKGPVAYVVLRMEKPANITSNDTAKMDAVRWWAADNAAGQWWLIWTPYMITEDGKEIRVFENDAMIVFEEESDAALFVLANNHGLMRLARASKGDLICESDIVISA